MSSDGSRLIGVAGIDVQTSGLGVNFRGLLDNNLINSRRIEITNNSIGATFANCSPVRDCPFHFCIEQAMPSTLNAISIPALGMLQRQKNGLSNVLVIRFKRIDSHIKFV